MGGALLGDPASVQAQSSTGSATLVGQVTDSVGTPLGGVVVRAERAQTAPLGGLTGAAGRYRITGLAPGTYQVHAQLLGYEGTTETVVLSAGEVSVLNLRLRSMPVALEAVVVEGRRDQQRERARFESEAGVTARVIDAREIRLLPGLAEADVLRAVEVMPGVISTSDLSSSFNVRGGSADQNLILLDGFPIFNPFHLGGLFSVFNSDVVARAELFAGGFSAEYGGRASSVLNVETKSYDGEPFGMELGVSVLATRVNLHSGLPQRVGRALGGSGGGWFVSARRSYFDKLLPAEQAIPYHLTDLQGGLTLGARGGGTLRVTAYTGADVLDMSDFDPQREGDAAGGDIFRVKWNWGNRLAGLRWTQPFGTAWLADVRLGYTRYGERFGLVDFDDHEFSSRIEQRSLRGELRRDLGSVLEARMGGELAKVRYRNRSVAGGSEFWNTGEEGVLSTGFTQLRWRPDEHWIIEPGLRLDSWSAEQSTHTYLSPRFAVKRFFGDERDLAAKVAAGRYVQFLHSLRDESFPISNDVWMITNADIPTVVSDQVQAGVEKFWGEQWHASVEGYYRRFRGIAAYNLADDPNDPSDDMLAGHGLSYGLDVLLRRSTGRLSGWTSISLLRAERTLPDPLADGWDDLPPETTYAPAFDRRADVELVLQYALRRRTEAGLRWHYGSPLPYTQPVGQYVQWSYDMSIGRYRLEPKGGGSGDPKLPLYVVLGARNGERYPAYHRLDVSIRHTLERRWGTMTPYLQVLNVYNRMNPLFYFYNYDRTPATMSGISMFPVLPTVGLEVAF
jgi:hypothetical protein